MWLARKSLSASCPSQSILFAWFLQIKSAPVFAARYADLWHCIRVHFVFIFMFTAGIASRQRTPNERAHSVSKLLYRSWVRSLCCFIRSEYVCQSCFSGICADGWCAADMGVSKVATLPAILNFEAFMMLCMNAYPQILCRPAACNFCMPVELVCVFLFLCTSWLVNRVLMKWICISS
jgi:hypothetical protein